MIHLFLILFITFNDNVAEELGTVSTCLPTHMRMEVDRTKNPDLVPEEMHLNDPNCTATQFNDTLVLFEIPLDGCGTTRDGSNPDYLLFSNTVHWDPSGQLITFTKGFRAHITCRYIRHGTVGVLVRIVPKTEEPPTDPQEKRSN